MKREREIQLIPLEEITISSNVRSHIDPASVVELADSIREKGLLQPVTLLGMGAGYSVVLGHRRLEAFRLLAERHGDQYSQIPAIIARGMGEDELKEVQLIENIQRENLSAQEVAETLRWFRSKGHPIKEIARRLGKSEGYVKNLSAVVKGIDESPELASLVATHEAITLTDLQEVKGLPMRPKMRLLKARATGEIATVRELREAVAEIRGQTPNPDSPAPRPRRAPASCLRVEDGNIVLLPTRFAPAELDEEGRGTLRAALEKALALLAAEAGSGAVKDPDLF